MNDAGGGDFAALARRASEDGAMRVGPLPSGRYRVRALNYARVVAEQDVTIRAGATLELELRL